MIQDYKDALSFLLSFVNYERLSSFSYDTRTFDIFNFKKFLKTIGNPQNAFPSVLIAGTKGKGSTAAMIANCLYHAGYRTGLFTSPHLVSFTERIRINMNQISEREFCSILNSIKPHLSKQNKKNKNFRTVFEILTAMAFIYFARKFVDIAIFEVGLGGRLDSTNVVSPVVSVITSISYDHTETLGKTLSKIAYEKAGIIKNKGIVILSPQRPTVKRVIYSIAKRRNAKLIQIGRDLKYKIQNPKSEIRNKKEQFNIKMRNPKLEVSNLSIPLLGSHQVENAATAFATLFYLRENGFYIPLKAIRRGLLSVRWEGRLEILRKKPLVILDGAHNADSALKLAIAVKSHFSYCNLISIVGIAQNKDIHGILKNLIPISNTLIATRYNNPRSASIETIISEIHRLSSRNLKIFKSNSSNEAWKIAREISSKDDLILVTGSLYLVGEFKSILEKDAKNE